MGNLGPSEGHTAQWGPAPASLGPLPDEALLYLREDLGFGLRRKNASFHLKVAAPGAYLEWAKGQFKKQLDLHGILWGEGEDDVVDSEEGDQQEGGLGQTPGGKEALQSRATPHPQAPPSCLTTGGSATVSPLLVYLAFILENLQLPHTQYLDSLSKLLDYATLSVKCVETRSHRNYAITYVHMLLLRYHTLSNILLAKPPFSFVG